MSHRHRPSWWLLWGLLLAASPATAQSPAPAAPAASTAGGEFIYRARAGDTLIGLASRLLLEPRRWPELQRRNGIADPRRIPRGSAIRIPYDWLRVSSQPARVIERTGTVRVDGREPAVGSTLEAGATIETAADGALTLEFADDSVLVVQPATRLRLERSQRIDGAATDESVLQLERGKVETQVRPRGDMGRFEIRTPAAVSAVRGTGFRAGFADGGGTTETLEGVVGVDAAGAGVAVRAGFGTRAEPGRPPSPPVPLLPAPALDAVPAVSDTATLRWRFAPVAGAARYRHQVARDPRFRALVAEATGTEPVAEFADVADGRYWIRSRAIDAAEIEGLDAVRELEQRRRLDAPQAIGPVGDARRIGASTRFEWAALDAASGYRFQLARDASFTPLVAERSIAAVPGGAPPATEVEGLAPGTYAWRVAALDAAGAAGHWGEAQRFVQKPPPVAVAALAPVTGGPPGRRSFHWDAHGGARGYEWQLARRDTFDRVVRSGRSDSPSLQLDDLQPGRWYLRVRSLDADGFEAPYGPPLEFAVRWPTWVRILVPALLVLPTL